MDTLRKNKNPWVLYETEVPHSRFCDPACGVSPAEKLTPEHLQLLRNAFTSPKAGAQMHENRPKGRSGRNRGGNEERGMKFEEFREVLRSVVGPDVEDTWVERFFSEVDISCTGQVKWQQLCSYLLLEYTERERASIPRAALLDSQPQIRHCSHNKREPTVRVVAVSHPPPLRYISVSKGGQITVWNSSLHILKTLGLAGDPTEEVANTRRFRGWTTDAVSMGNVHKVAIATDCRDLHFVNVSGSVFEDVHLFGFRSVPTALCYWYDVQCPERPSLLILGDEKGGVHLMWFLDPSKGLFKNPSKAENGPQRIFFPDLAEHSKTVSYRHIPNIHQEPINRVMFEPGTNVVMTSSESDTTSVVFMSVTLKQEPYIWKFKQGAKCFDYSASLQLIVTGSCDRAVRLWTRYVTTSPVATLLGHRATVLDVAIYQPVGQIFSYSRDAELRVWDISSHHCLKTVGLQFPCQQPGRIPEHGNFPFLLLSPPLPEQTQSHLVVGCKDYLALLNLAETRRGGGGWLTDEGPNIHSGPALSCALYSSTLRQVATGHTDSSVSLWDVETGRRRLQILNAHGEEELTCMALDSSHRRLITGARNGTIKVWNLLNGLNLHKLEPVTNSEVTGLTCLRDNQLLSVGWSQRIAQYDIAAAKDLYIRADMSWKSSGVHKSDILAVCQCSALGVVATASHDGEVIIWRLETQGPVLHLQRPTQRGAVPPVDDLLFLQHRASNRKLRNRGVLVSSQAGCLCFWSVTGQTHTYGQFYAPEQPGERVLSLTSDQPQNNILVSGDTTGRVQIWDICHYALDIQHEPVCERPPLLQSWRAHERALVSVDVLEVADGLFVLTASADGSAGLWTKDGDHVGSFGQEVMWNISEPATYQRKTQKKLTEDTKEERTEGDDPGLSEVKGQVPGPANRGQTSQEECCSEASPASPAENVHEQPQQPQQPMYLCEDLCNNRRHRFEDIHHSNHC
ncbi:WD repeat-containing protein on Y chromosome isoform X1 [Sebastes umbrosus]|uniref:WD repeat-containing protein on Y chromosome isoform X1 n=2 Tax=Sebastes umbrosus TaxID=72105 RepID=UPI0018A0B249|nr:WD repeat-containing protein on Y chromosome isoform X1 [Sebastes umbrosus]XP_037611581.1 WD repeat-containing protein on Y chromosome isoform X1 [Sebastes umbrosus]